MNSRPKHSRAFFIGLGVIFLLSALFSGCSSPVKGKTTLESLFEEGKVLFYRTVADEVSRHPLRGRLSTQESEKIAHLEKVYPRLYGILVNYYYPKDEPEFRALLEAGSDGSRARFREKYLDLSRFASKMFVESIFRPSSHGAYFQDIVPRFKGKDVVDIVAMSTGHLANLDLPTRIVPKILSPEFDKQWGLDAAKFRTAHLLTKGRGARIAVIDSGIDVSHPVFKNTRWGKHVNFVGRDGFPWKPEGPPMVDWGWHGTLVTSIVAKYAPEAEITVYREIDADTQNDSPYPLIVTSLMGAAIYKAVHDGNDVINISAGSNLDTAYLREACQYAYENNVIVVTASPYYLGKYLGQNEDYPGQYPTTISVTGIEKRGENQYGYWDVAAPEVTTTVGSPDAPFVAFPTYVNEKDDYAPGISCATPIVASLVSLVASVYPRQGAERPGEYFETMKRLLIENADSKAVGFEGYSPECGYGLINAEKTVKAAIELGRERLARSRQVPQEGGYEKSMAFQLSKFPEALKLTKGKGIKLAIIDSDRDQGKGAPPMISIASACAPEAEIRLYPISPNPNATHDYASAVELAKAVSKAAGDKNDIIATSLSFPLDVPFLKEACQSAYLKNIVIIAPGGLLGRGNSEPPFSYPAHFKSAIAVSGVLWDRKNKLVPWDLTAPSNCTLVASPAAADKGSAPSMAIAAASTAGLAALIASKLPKTEKDLPGQYVQRIREILAKSANPRLLGFLSFNPAVGYGLIDAQKTIEEGVPAYKKKMQKIDEDFKKRMEQRTKEQAEASRKESSGKKK